MASKKTATPVAEICLYGNRSTGAGWLAIHSLGARLLGDGEPVAGRSFTEATWIAARALTEAGWSGAVAIYEPGGERMAICDLASVPSYGSLPWQPAAHYEVSEAAIVAAAAGVSLP